MLDLFTGISKTLDRTDAEFVQHLAGISNSQPLVSTE
jgi:hypothetical protein